LQIILRAASAILRFLNSTATLANYLPPRLLLAITRSYLGIVGAWVLFDGSICSRNLGLQDWCFSRTNFASTLGNELVLWSSFVDTSKFFLTRTQTLSSHRSAFSE
jgi:hypothetical protein